MTPKGAYEPWMLFRKPIAEKTVAENLRQWKTGGLRRLGPDKPLPDSIPSGRTPDREEAISDHPCLKPQHFMRIIVRALLPLESLRTGVDERLHEEPLGESIAGTPSCGVFKMQVPMPQP